MTQTHTHAARTAHAGARCFLDVRTVLLVSPHDLRIVVGPAVEFRARNLAVAVAIGTADERIVGKIREIARAKVLGGLAVPDAATLPSGCYNAPLTQPGTWKATMKIHGVSQSSGVERQLKIERCIDGIVLTLTDTVGSFERGWIQVPGDHILAAIMAPPAGGSTIEGILLPRGGRMTLDVEVRRNEVWLCVHPGDAADIAVGLDDLQDALEGVINQV